MTDDSSPRFKVPLPGGRVAAVPLEVLEQYADPEARTAHGHTAPRPPEPDDTNTVKAGGAAITINIYADRGKVSVDHNAHDEEDDDVTAHSLTVDATTGTSEWHTDWEYGECEYTDESGFPQRIQAWHRHPFGTEYSELYEG
jgi:hypothetical protein